MDKSKVALTSLVLLVFAIPAHAYIGPGAGLSLIGALWALIAAIAAALVFMLAWPIRRMRRRRREANAGQTREQPVARDSTTQNARVTRQRRDADDEEDLDRLPTR